jgi:uncharacterized cupin superfamily protein
MAQAIDRAAPGSASGTGIDLYDLDQAFARMAQFPSENLDILGGHPESHRGHVIYRDPSRRLSLGVWECPPGTFRLVEEDATIERCKAGKARLTDLSTGESVVVTPGMQWVVRPGTEMIWDVLEPFRKEYIAFGAWEEERYW